VESSENWTGFNQNSGTDWNRAGSGRIIPQRPEGSLGVRQLTILVADDEPVVRMVLEDMLHRLGYRVLTAEDGEQALEVFRLYDGQVDLMIFDLSMPKMSGEELFAEIRRVSPAVHTIMITGYNEVISLEQLRLMGLSGFIAKPFGIEEIKLELHRVLEE
jgi:two-component system, cell cycle sensor histidine kinase and response regulator CckA